MYQKIVNKKKADLKMSVWDKIEIKSSMKSKKNAKQKWKE